MLEVPMISYFDVFTKKISVGQTSLLACQIS